MRGALQGFRPREAVGTGLGFLKWIRFCE
jgi:hypothetical protein